MAGIGISFGINAGVRTGLGALQRGYTEGDLAYDIVISVADTGVDIAMDAGIALLTKSAGGALFISLAFVAVQILLDVLWNPFETKFNKDLEDTRKRIRDEWTKELRAFNLTYPLTAKPDIWENMTEDDWVQFRGDVQDYFTQHDLVYPAALEQRDYAKRILDLQRQATFIENSGKLIDIANDSMQEQQKILELEERTFQLLLAAAVLYNKRKKVLADQKATASPVFTLAKYSTALRIGGIISSIFICCLCFLCFLKVA